MLYCIRLPDACVSAWIDMKVHHKHRYILFTFSKDLEKVVVECAAPKEATYDNFLHDLPPCDARYALYDYKWKADDGIIQSKVVLIFWVPDAAPAKRKMLFASKRSDVRSVFLGIAAELEATNESEIQESKLVEKLKNQSH
jgi:cofilin